jgi:hypothetical protein
MTVDPRARPVADIATVPLFDIVDDLHPPLVIGGPTGRRVFFGASGGSFHGPLLHGEVLPGGGDWAVFRTDGTMTLDVRLTLRTHDGALIAMTYGGRFVRPAEVRDELADPERRALVSPDRYYFRTTPLFETGDPRYAWLNDVVAIGSGYLVEGGVAYRVSQVV